MVPLRLAYEDVAPSPKASADAVSGLIELSGSAIVAHESVGVVIQRGDTNDVGAPKAMVLAMAGQAARLKARNSDLGAQTNHLVLTNKASDERIATLTAIVKTPERARYGRRSERLHGAVLDDDQYAFVLDEIETGLWAIQAKLQCAAQERPNRAPRPRKGFAAHLERVEQVIEPEVPAAARIWKRC